MRRVKLLDVSSINSHPTKKRKSSGKAVATSP
nr:MAG TPA: hypothetical protein [Caudoviricetes sp.]